MNGVREVCLRRSGAGGRCADWEGAPATGWKEPSRSTCSTPLAKKRSLCGVERKKCRCGAGVGG